MRSLRGPDDKCVLSNCRLAQLSGGNKVLRVTQHSVDKKESQSMERKDSIALALPGQTDIPDNMVKSGTSKQAIEKQQEPKNSNIKSDEVTTKELKPDNSDIKSDVVKKEQEPNSSNFKSDVVEKEQEPKSNNIKSDVVKKEQEPSSSNIKSDVAKKETVIISVVTTAPVANPILKHERRPKKHIKPTKSLDLEDQRKDVEHILNQTKSVYTTNTEINILNDAKLTKDMVIKFVKNYVLSSFY